MSATRINDWVQGLRRWANGLYPLEAAVELLARAFGGRFTRGWRRVTVRTFTESRRNTRYLATP